MNSYFKYMPIDSFMHRVNPLIKYFINIILVLSLPFLDPQNYIFIILFLYVSVKLAKISLIYFHRGLSFLIYLYIVILFITILYPNMDAAFFFTSVVRIYIVVGYALLIIMTTKFSDLIIFFNLIFSFLNDKNREKLLFIVILTLSFIPIILKKLSDTRLALRSRGLNFKVKNFVISTQYLFTTLLKNIDILTDSYDLAIYGRNINQENIKYLKLKHDVKISHIIYIMIFVVTLFII